MIDLKERKVKIEKDIVDTQERMKQLQMALNQFQAQLLILNGKLIELNELIELDTKEEEE